MTAYCQQALACTAALSRASARLVRVDHGLYALSDSDTAALGAPSSETTEGPAVAVAS
jgi:hypothetical protein